MKNLLNKLFAFLIIFILAPNIVYAASLCQPKGYVIGFFNDESMLERSAKNQLERLKSIYGSTYNGESIKYELFYNTANTLDWQMYEVYAQKLEELGYKLGYNEGEFYDILFFILQGKDAVLSYDTVLESIKNTAAQILLEAFPILQNFVEDTVSFVNVAVGVIIAGRIQQEYNEVTIYDYQMHYNRMVALLTEQRKIILVGHSQGNFFLNNVYKESVGRSDAIYSHLKTSVGGVYVAPMTGILHGNYILNKQDVTVELFDASFGDVPKPNVDYVGGDIGNHDFVKTYLMQGSPGKSMIISSVSNLLKGLETPPTTGNEGLFTATLTWDGVGDIDLYVREPTGTQVYYRNPEGDAGYLDVDNRDANGPEHYYASCEEEKVREGLYTIGANNYARGNGRIATLQLSTYSGGMLSTKSIPIGKECGMKCDIKYFFSVKVAKTENSEVEITVE